MMVRIGRGGRRGAVALAVAVTLGGGGAGAVAWAATHQVAAPQPGAAAAGRLDTSSAGSPAAGAGPAAGPGPGPAGVSGTPSTMPSRVPLTAASDTPAGGSSRPSGRTVPVSGPVLPRSTPTSITIPAIGVHSPLQALGRNADGSIQVPQPGPHYNEAAWYRFSPTPGELGPAVIEGHVDSAADGPSVFFRLGALKPGQQVLVGRADGSTAIFTVNAVRRYPKDRFPTTQVYSDTDHAALRLITCGGAFDAATGHYLDNIVVFAHLTGSR